MNDDSHTTPLKPAPVIASPDVTHTGPGGDVTVLAIRDKAVNRYKRKETTPTPTPPEPPLTPANPYKKRTTIASVPPNTPLNPYKKRAANVLPLATPLNPYKKRFIPATSMNEAALTLLDFHDFAETPLKRSDVTVVTPSPNATTARSFTTTRPCLRQMLLDFRTSMSDNRGRGSHMPANVITTIVDTVPVPRTVHELSLVKHVGKALLNKHGSSILKICIQFMKDVKVWDTINNPNDSDATALFELNASPVSPMVSITPSTFLDFLRPSLPVGPVKDLYLSACKQAQNGYNIQGNVIPASIRPVRNLPLSTMLSSEIVLPPSLPSEYLVSPLNSRRALIEDLMLVPPGCPLQLLVPTSYKSKKKGTPMSPIVNNYCLQKGITNPTRFELQTVSQLGMHVDTQIEADMWDMHADTDPTLMDT